MEKMTHTLQFTGMSPIPVEVVPTAKGEGKGWNPNMRAFETGATRDQEHGKLDFEGFLSPLVLKRYAEYMHSKRHLADGTMRDSDNWQLGIPLPVYMKSLWRHFFSVWFSFRASTIEQSEEDMCAVLFNQMGMLHEVLKKNKK